MTSITLTTESNDSPSFNTHSSNTVADTANRVTDSDFSFSNDETPTSITAAADSKAKSYTHNSNEDEIEFEFPVDEHISPRFPLFDRTLLLDHKSEIEPAPVRFSLGKLLIEARESGSCSSSDADELEGITPEIYCVWKPNESPRGKHKKSNSVSIGNSSKRWNIRDLLKRSYSDDSYTTGNVSPVLLFSPPVSLKPKAKNESVKTGNKVPAYKGKIGNIRVPAYYPYRQDQIGYNNNGSTKNLYRY